MKLPQNKEAQYNGEIQSADINIGKLIGYEILGNSIFKGRFEGESFNPEKINLNYKLNISKFNFNNYNYNSLDIAGNLNNQTLNSIINIDDNNFRSKNLNLQLSFQNNINTKVEGKLEHVNFKALNFADKYLSLTSRIDAEIKGMKKVNPNGSFDVTTRLKHIITSVEGKRDQKDIRDFVDNYLIAKDARALREYYSKISPDINLKYYPEDSAGEGIDIPVSVNFFWPDAGI